MKKLYILLFTILISGLSFGQSPIITAIVDGDCAGGTPKLLEIYADGAVDFTLYSLQNQTNANITWGATLDLSALGTVTDDFVYITSSSDFTILNAEFPSINTSVNILVSSTINLNGDDRIRIVLTADTTVIDQYGVSDEDGTGQTWETLDSYAKRINGTGPDGGFNQSNWIIPGVSTLDGGGTCQGGSTFESMMGGIGTYSTTPSTDPTIAISEGPSSGSTIDLSPEELSGSLQFVVTNFNVDTQGNGGDGYIVWIVVNTTTSTTHDEGGPLYDFTPDPFIPLEANNSYSFEAQLISYATSNVVAEYTLNINALGYTDVSSVAELRAVTDDGYYRLTNEAFLTFQQSFRGQKFIQDATGGILIDDNNGRIGSPYAINDGITNIRGQVSEFGGMKQLIPSADYGVPSSTGNTITPQTVTLADLTANAEQYESELVQVISVTLDNSVNTTFINGAEYAMSQSTDNFNFRTTFYDVDYIDATVPTVSTDVVGIINERPGGLYFLTARDTNDISALVLSNDTFEENKFRIFPNPTNLGYVKISSKNSARMDVTVFDILGKQVLNKTLSNNTLDVSGLTSGMYIMKVVQDNASVTKKLVIQ